MPPRGHATPLQLIALLPEVRPRCVAELTWKVDYCTGCILLNNLGMGISGDNIPHAIRRFSIGSPPGLICEVLELFVYLFHNEVG